MTKPHVAILMGGWSSEREVSIISGNACAKVLEDTAYTITKIDVTKDIGKLIHQLETTKPDVVLNMLHGPFGEDGCIQGLLEMMNIPYSHSNVLSSALAMDKQKTKDILSPYGIKSPKGQLLTRDEYMSGQLVISPPYVVKPNSEGSSFGVAIVLPEDNYSPLDEDKTWGYGTGRMLIESYIPGRELTVAVMGDKSLAVTEIIPNTEFYDYTAKYGNDGSSHVLPADINPDIYNAVMEQALLAHKKLGCTGVTRSDFRYDESKDGIEGLYFLEINTQPGMTPTSLVPEQAEYKGISFTELVIWMIKEVFNREHSNHVFTQEENTQNIA